MLPEVCRACQVSSAQCGRGTERAAIYCDERFDFYTLSVLSAFVLCHPEGCFAIWSGIFGFTSERLPKTQRWAMNTFQGKDRMKQSGTFQNEKSPTAEAKMDVRNLRINF